MTFFRTIKAPETHWQKAYFLIFNEKGDLLVEKKNDGQISLPCLDKDAVESLQLEYQSLIGSYDTIPCFCGSFSDLHRPDTYQWQSLRTIFNGIEPDFWDAIGYARGINDCHVNNKFCGKCGKETKIKMDEHGRFCQKCNLTFYPRISPAIITAVIKEDTILLARGINFPNKKMFSVLAGFVEPQERLEDCVRREVFEETGIRVKNVAYFDSQPWPFPDSLMIGFTAEYESGTLAIDPSEIVEAAWFKAEELPLVPGKPTLSGELIQWFVNNQKTLD